MWALKIRKPYHTGTRQISPPAQLVGILNSWLLGLPSARAKGRKFLFEKTTSTERCAPALPVPWRTVRTAIWRPSRDRLRCPTTIPIVYKRFFFLVEQRKTLKKNYFVKQRDVKGKSELVFQTDFVGQLIAEFPRRGRRIGQQRFRVSVHESDGQHYRFFRFRRLRKRTYH